MTYTEQFLDFDPFLTMPDPSNPWISDDITFWELEARFWLAVQDLKRRPLQAVSARVQEIWQEFLAPGAPSAINLDSHSYERTSQNMKDPGRYSFEDAQEHIYKLMKSDSYARFLRSSTYQDLLLAKKKVAPYNT
ncbi:Regulator of G-protein signaling 6 [Acipenser ruthenus]|uniref:Regulator of G-protein signaling 6 n=1 Tax=Acipenser ruthenus TaxID=7906 RepID=A0A444USD1_ACIRT|nr:Regulator of G-protein signaling 6 [Acipenser ruthenus]